MEAVPAIGGISEYEPPKTQKEKVEQERPEQVEAQTMDNLHSSKIKAADQQQSFKKSVVGAAYTGKGSFFDTVI